MLSRACEEVLTGLRVALRRPLLTLRHTHSRGLPDRDTAHPTPSCQTMEAQKQPTRTRTAVNRRTTRATPSSRKRPAREWELTQPVRPKSPRRQMQPAQPMRVARSAPHPLPPIGVGHSSSPRLMKIRTADVCALAPQFSQLRRPHPQRPAGAGRLKAGVGLPLNPALPHGAGPGARCQNAWDPARSPRGLKSAPDQETHGPEATPLRATAVLPAKQTQTWPMTTPS